MKEGLVPWRFTVFMYFPPNVDLLLSVNTKIFLLGTQPGGLNSSTSRVDNYKEIRIVFLTSNSYSSFEE